MATQSNAPYKLKQRRLDSLSEKRILFVSTTTGFGGETALAVRDGKLNKKSGRRLATSYVAA